MVLVSGDFYFLFFIEFQFIVFASNIVFFIIKLKQRQTLYQLTETTQQQISRK